MEIVAHILNFALLSNNFSRNNCVRLAAYLQLHIYEKFHLHLILRFLSLFRRGTENRGRGRGWCQLNKEIINIKKHNYKSYVNSKIILADVKLANSEKQIRDGGHRGEERCIVLIDTDEIAII